MSFEVAALAIWVVSGGIFVVDVWFETYVSASRCFRALEGINH